MNTEAPFSYTLLVIQVDHFVRNSKEKVWADTGPDFCMFFVKFEITLTCRSKRILFFKAGMDEIAKFL